MVALMVFALVILGFALFVGFLIVWGAKHSKTNQRNFTELATRLGLTVEVTKPKFGLFGSTPDALGSLRRRPARLFAYNTGSGKSRVTWAALSVKPRELGGLTFTISRQDFGSKISQLFGAREIKVGDPVFDQTWFIQTNQPEFFQAALIPELRERLTAVLRSNGHPRRPSFSLETDHVLYSEVGDFSSEARCARLALTAEVLCDLADVAEVFAQHAQPGR